MLHFIKRIANENRSFPDVFRKELKDIDQRRGDHHTRSDDTSRFTLLKQALSIPADERTDAFNSLLDDLQDPRQTEIWEEYCEKRKQEDREKDRSCDPELVGVAFSGGGIRSSTFNLGVLQALATVGLFKFVDYLSTVSGGGYIGSCLSSLYASPSNHFPFLHEQGKVEASTFRHLRNNAEYLAPNGLFDTLRIPMLLLRGFMINILVVLPYVAAAALITAMLKPDLGTLDHLMLDKFINIPTWLGTHFVLLKVLFGLLLLAFILYPIGYMLFQRSRFWLFDSAWASRDRVGRCLSWTAIILGLVAFMELQPVAIAWLAAKIAGSSDMNEFIHGFVSIVTGLTVLPAFVANWAANRASKLRAGVALTLIGLCGVAIFWLVYLYLAYLFINNGLGTNLWLWGLIVAVWAYGTVFVDINHTSLHGFYRDRLSKAYLIKFSDPDQSDAMDAKLVHNDEQLLQDLNTADSPYHLINAAINLTELEEHYKKGRRAQSFIFSKQFIGSAATGYCPTAIMAANSRKLNLGTAMAISGAAASPHMGKNTNRILAFVLAMANVRLNHWLPNPKFTRKRKWAWLPRAPFTRVGPGYLILEMIGKLTANSINVNLSDGGHFENLALYELLRRECRFIVCGDGEADKRLTFNGLADAVRMAQVDFGIKIEIDGLDEIRAGEQNYAIGKIKYSDDRIGWLLYIKLSMLGDNSLESTLLSESAYESSPLRDDNRRYDDNAYIAHYKSKNPDFPHQTTADQFFSEDQFEAYRALGYLVGMRTLTR